MSAYKSNNNFKDYEEYKTSRGEIVKIHAVPQPIVRAIVPARPKPEVPIIKMQTKTGTQNRPAKPGDAEWDSYTTNLKNWEEERDDLQEAITFALALKSYKFPDTLSLSPEIQQLVDAGLLKVPEGNIYQRKLLWIRENVLGQHDEYNVNMIIHKLSGVPEDIIDEMKANFRNTLLGKTARVLAEGAEEQTSQPEADVQEQ